MTRKTFSEIKAENKAGAQAKLEKKKAAKVEKDAQKLAERPEMSENKAHFDDMRFATDHGIPTIHPRLRFSRDGMIHFKGKTMPVEGCVATVETSGSVTRTGGFFIAHRRDDRVFLLTIDGPKGIFEVSVRANNLAAETRVRKVARYINVTNKPGTDSDKLHVR